MKKLTCAQWLVLALALLTLAIGVVTNYATASPPRWMATYPWAAWAILGVLALAFVLLSLIQARLPGEAAHTHEPGTEPGDFASPADGLIAEEPAQPRSTESDEASGAAAPEQTPVAAGGFPMNQTSYHVFLSYSDDNQDFAESLARRLQGDARLSFWFGPWHSIPGEPSQEQMEAALWAAGACAVLISSPKQIQGWQNTQMRTAIQTRVEDDASYRVIPVLLPGTTRPNKRDLPRFLRLYEAVEFTSLDDDQAFKRLLAGILGTPPIQVEVYLQSQVDQVKLAAPPSAVFEGGHALVIGVANYPEVRPLPETVLNDAHDLRALLTDPAACGYAADNVAQLLDAKASGAAIRVALVDLAARAGPNDTAVVFFSGHGAHDDDDAGDRQYILPYDCDPDDLPGTAIPGDEMTELLLSIRAGRLLVLVDSCHSGGAGDPKGALPHFKAGLSERYYETLAQGKGRVVIASCRPDEVSWALSGMSNSLFTHYVLEALRGQGKTLGDGYVRVFDVFRHVADHVPARAEAIQASQHPIFKATAMEEDFPIAFARG